jgi:hypothetical protein
MCTAFAEGNDVMHFLCRYGPAFPFANFTQRMLCQMLCPDFPPLPAISLFGSWITTVFVIIGIDTLLV